MLLETLLSSRSLAARRGCVVQTSIDLWGLAVSLMSATAYYDNQILPEQDIHVTAYSPLGTPDSKDMMKREETPSLMEDPAVVEISKEHDAHPVQV